MREWEQVKGRSGGEGKGDAGVPSLQVHLPMIADVQETYSLMDRGGGWRWQAEGGAERHRTMPTSLSPTAWEVPWR